MVGGPVATPGIRPGGGAVVAGRGPGNWSGSGWRHHHHRPGFWPGFAVGAGIGSAYGYYGNSYYYDDPYYYDDTAVVAAAPPAGDDAVAYCMQRYKSYDPASGTYLGYDGQRHPCPAQ
ncbi:BA14K family protein [Bradyrhizobium jicamae]